MVVEGESSQQRRHNAHGMNRRTDVVVKTWQRNLGRAASAAHGVLRLEDQHGAPRLGHHDGSGEPIRTCTDNDGVVRVTHSAFIINGGESGDSVPCAF